ncbi:MAG TPA: type II secretion system F family protein, partial [Planctomycetes bacterium]|nr:type II secretion system F family protein [Planctomycetota bacterium]
LFVVSLGAAEGVAARSRRRGKRIGKRDLLTLTSQLAIMVRVGVDFATALGNVAKQCPHPGLKAVLDQVHEDVLAGKSVSAALSAHEHVFGQTYVASVAAAEKAGRLAEVLDRLAHLLRCELRMRSTVRTLLAYPVLLSVISVLAVVGLILFVLPQFAVVFQDLEVPLPVVTRCLLSLSHELTGRLWLWGGSGVASLVCLAAFFRGTRGRRIVDALLLNAVLVRDVTRSLLVGRVFQLLGTMVESGVPLLDGLRLTRSAVRNTLMRDLIQRVEEGVLNGRGIGTTFLEARFIPPAAAQMIATAEHTGTVATVAQLMGQYYEEEGERRLKELATVLEPLIIVVMGGVIATIVMSVMLPVFDFATMAK